MRNPRDLYKYINISLCCIYCTSNGHISSGMEKKAERSLLRISSMSQSVSGGFSRQYSDRSIKACLMPDFFHLSLSLAFLFLSFFLSFCHHTACTTDIALYLHIYNNPLVSNENPRLCRAVSPPTRRYYATQTARQPTTFINTPFMVNRTANPLLVLHGISCLRHTYADTIFIISRYSLQSNNDNLINHPSSIRDWFNLDFFSP